MEEDKDKDYRLTIDIIMIVGKYLETPKDFINLIRMTKKYSELVDMYKMNPISDWSIFPNIETQHFYNLNDLMYAKRNLYRYVYWKTNKKFLDLIGSPNDSMVIKRKELNTKDMKLKKKMVIPEGIWRIGDEAFKYEEINSVKLPSTLREIGNDAFNSCDIEELNLPKGVTSLGDSCFNDCQLKKVKFPRSLLRIGKYCFNRSRLKQIIIPENIKELDDHCFSNSLVVINDVYLPDGLEKIHPKAFYNSRINTIHASKKVRSLVEKLHFEKKPKLTTYNKLNFKVIFN